MPDERNRRADADAPTGAAGNRGDASVAPTAESAAATSKDRNERVDAPAPSTGMAAPLITAVEIENFKGIGRPMRVEFRPITLLFGNNSAGKSTVLHALCYAHEILSHRNVDVHETEIGGDRIDLGGFRNLVHAHDTTRTVRLRFELNLGEWRVPQPFAGEIENFLVEFAPQYEADADEFVFPGSERPKSGWIELQAQLRDEQAVLTSYELGINQASVGRLVLRQPAGISLELDLAHPVAKHCAPEAATTGKDNQSSEQSVLELKVYGLHSPIPHWNEIFLLPDDDQAVIPTRAALSALFVGVGQALNTELARLRYIGPVRRIHLQTPGASARDRARPGGPQSSHPASWADGSAAWTHLHTNARRGMIEEVSEWLARANRLDTGYALRARYAVTIYEDETQLVSELREYHQLRKTYGNAKGSVDLAGWLRGEAEAIVDKTDPHYRQAALEHCDRLRAMFASAAESVDDWTRAYLQTNPETIREVQGNDVRPGIRREAERYRRLAEDLRHLLTLSIQDIELQITSSGEDLVSSSETLTSAYCRRLNDLLPEWESGAPMQIYLMGIVDGLRTMPDRDDLPEKVEGMENEFRRDDLSVEVEQLLGEFRGAIQATVASARRNYRRLTTLVAKMENGNFPPGELGALAAAVAARPPRREIELITTKNELPVRVADVGVGISQVLPVVVAALDGDRPGITAIEQPEIHLHPRLQVELGDLFAQQIDNGGAFLIETHSEHLLLRFMKRMRQTCDGALAEGAPKVRPEDIAVYFVEIDPKGDQTLIREMPLNERGDLVKAWPGGFFEEDLREIF